MSRNELKLGTHGEHTVLSPVSMLRVYIDNVKWGPSYYRFQPATPATELWPEDNAWADLLIPRASPMAFISLLNSARTIDLRSFPATTLAEATSEQREQTALMVGKLVALGGFGVSRATKVLHKKRPTLVPVLDARGVFGSYLRAGWKRGDAIQPVYVPKNAAARRVRAALDAIHTDLNRTQNESAWAELVQTAPKVLEFEPTRLELFDIVWWAFAWFGSRSASLIQTPAVHG